MWIIFIFYLQTFNKYIFFKCKKMSHWIKCQQLKKYNNNQKLQKKEKEKKEMGLNNLFIS